jgi:hypothetical protein
MKIPLIVEPEDSKWKLLKEIYKLFDTRRFQQEIAKAKLKPNAQCRTTLKILFCAMFFAEEISYVVRELEKREELRTFLDITSVPSPDDIYRFSSRFEPEQFLQLTLGYLNYLCKKRSSQSTVIIDSTDIQIDLNWFKRKIKKADLEGKPYTWGYSSSKGYYIGYTLTLVVEYPLLRPVYFIIHRGSPNDAHIFLDILNRLKRKRMIRNGDTIITDKGYCSYHNYHRALSQYKVIPLIFPRKNMSINKILAVSYPLQVFSDMQSVEREKKFFIGMKEKFEKKIKKWKDFKPLRSRIEDIFKLLKEGLYRGKIHRYTEKSCHRFVICSVLLAGAIIYVGIRSKEHLQTLAES